jgi:hypothetical protein
VSAPVVLALARALIDHPERTLNSTEIDSCIIRALADEAVPVEGARRSDWARVERSATAFLRELCEVQGAFRSLM